VTGHRGPFDAQRETRTNHRAEALGEPTAQELIELLETLEPLWGKVLEAFKRYAEEEE
jgi:hypothetical protein